MTLLQYVSGDHVIIDNDRVKLCNLTSAVVCSGIEYDEDMLEDVMMTLPPLVLPPEVDIFSFIFVIDWPRIVRLIVDDENESTQVYFGFLSEFHVKILRRLQFLYFC